MNRLSALRHADVLALAALLQSPSQDKFARIPLGMPLSGCLRRGTKRFTTIDMIDFWRFDLRLPTSAIDPNAPSAFVARISDLDALPFSFFNETYDEVNGFAVACPLSLFKLGIACFSLVLMVANPSLDLESVR